MATSSSNLSSSSHSSSPGVEAVPVTHEGVSSFEKPAAVPVTHIFSTEEEEEGEVDDSSRNNIDKETTMDGTEREDQHQEQQQPTPPQDWEGDEDSRDYQEEPTQQVNSMPRNKRPKSKRKEVRISSDVGSCDTVYGHHQNRRHSSKKPRSFTTYSTKDLSSRQLNCEEDCNDIENCRERLAMYQARMSNDPDGRRHSATSPSPSPPKRKRSKQISRTSSRQEDSSKTLIKLLALQVYHLPGNDWWQDWRQYMTNNHPLFGICCHHRLHPIGSCTRLVALLGSVIFGLVLTTLFYLFYLYNPEFNQVAVIVVSNNGDEWILTTGMLLLWTVGGGLHATYNLMMWHIAACACCRPGGCCESIACCPSFGKRLLRVFLLLNIVLGAMVAVLRVAITNTVDFDKDAQEGMNQTNVDGAIAGIDFLDDDQLRFEVDNVEEFQFIAAYLVEMVLALFIYYPIGGTILFSGILGCGTLPFLGGRPQEVASEARKLQRKHDKFMRDHPSGITLASYTERCGPDGDCQASISPNEHDVELVWSPHAVREFERRGRR